MITHIALIGPCRVTAEIRESGPGSPEPDCICLGLGDSLALHLDPEVAEAIAEALIDSLTTRDDAITEAAGPVAYIPTWAPA